MKLISRQEARQRGLLRYFTGKPCVHGHIAERSIDMECVQCRREKARRSSKRKKPPNDKTKFVYIIGAPGWMHKVGRTANVEARLTALRAASPVPLELIRAIAVQPPDHASELEIRLHEALSEYRSHGEWFCIRYEELMPIVERCIGTLPIDAAIAA